MRATPLERSTPALIGFAVLAALAVWLQNAIIPFSKPFWGLFDYQFDLDVYRAGAQTVLDGGDLYRTKLMGGMDFTYAPISIVVFAPFAWMATGLAHIVWTVGIFIALYLVIVLGFRSLGHRNTATLHGIAVCLVVVSLLLEPVRTTIWFGQINVFLMLLILADLLRGEDSRLRGAGAGLAAGIKLTPLIFVGYLMVLRQWRAAITLLGTFLLTVVVGAILMPSASKDYWTETLFDSDRVASPQTAGNQSIRGALANLGHTDEPSTLAWVLLSVLAVALGLGAAVLAHRHGQELLALSLVGMTSCIVSPVAWGHHWVWLVPLLIVAIHLGFTLRSTAARIVVGLATLAGFTLSIAWRHHLAYPGWYVNRSVDAFYLTGTFFKGVGHWYRWFIVQPYNMIFVIVAVTVIVVYGLRELRKPDGPRRGQSSPVV